MVKLFMLSSKLQFEIVPEEFFIKIFWKSDDLSPKAGYGLKFKYLGMLENNTLERDLIAHLNKLQKHFSVFLNKYLNQPLELLTEEDLIQIKNTVINSI